MNLLPFTQSWVDEIQVLISRKFPEECRTYEKDYPDNRDSRGRLIGRKPLKIWYPNQNLEEKDKWECDFGRPYMRCKQR